MRPAESLEEHGLEEQLRTLREALSDYELFDGIQRGGQGVVFKARQRRTGRTVALKVLLDGPLASERQRYRFEREIELISRLRHPNVVTLYDSGVVCGRHYFAMEYIEGIPIDDYVILHDLRPRQIVALFVKICQAINYAHQNGIIHRDLKPGNVLVDSDGQPHVFDFGLATDVWDSDDKRLYSFTGQVVGTLPYLSPEQAGGLDGKADVRSDVYALGVILYQLLTDMFPYEVTGQPQEVQGAIVSAEPLSLRKAWALSEPDRAPGTSEVNRDLELILGKALAKPKEQRYQSVAEFADDLERYRAGDAIHARPPSALYLLRKGLRRHRIAASVAASVLATLSLASIVVTAAWLEARRQRDNARAAAQEAYGAFSLALDEIEGSVRSLPGGLAVRDRLVDDLEQRLPQLGKLAVDVELTPIAAALREKQGDIAAEQGRKAEARVYYQAFLDQSLQLAAAPSTPEAAGRPFVSLGRETSAPPAEYADAAVRAYRKLAEVSEDPEPLYEQAVAYAQAVLACDPDRDEARYNLCSTHASFGEHLQMRGEYERAIAHYQRALALSPDEGTTDPLPRWGALLASANSGEGRVLVRLGKTQAGIAAIERGLQIREQIVARNPADVEARRALVLSSKHLASLKRSAGDLSGARTLLLKATAEADRLAEMDPSATDWDRERFALWYALTRNYLEAGELEEASAHCRKTIDLANKLLRVAPGDLDSRRNLAYGLILDGRIHAAKGAWDDARDSFERALSLRESVYETDPGNPTSPRELAGAYHWVGSTLRRTGNAEQALPYYVRAHEIRQNLAHEHPQVARYELDAIDATVNLTAAYISLASADAAAQATSLLDAAAARLEQLHTAGSLDGLERDYTRRRDAIFKNKRLLNRRNPD